jgi:hypothetical protein
MHADRGSSLRAGRCEANRPVHRRGRCGRGAASGGVGYAVAGTTRGLTTVWTKFASVRAIVAVPTARVIAAPRPPAPSFNAIDWQTGHLSRELLPCENEGCATLWWCAFNPDPTTVVFNFLFDN